MESSILQKLNKVYGVLQDEESRMLFDARLQFIIDRDQDKFEEKIASLYDDWFCIELKERLDKIKVDGIIIFGCGHDGKNLKKHLEHCGYRIDYFCDSDNKKVGTICDGIKILSLEDVVTDYRRYLIIIGSSAYGQEMYNAIKNRKFPVHNVLLPAYKTLVCNHGKQYFDVFPPMGKETFVDCGSYNGDTILDFYDWTKGDYGQVFAFEPIKDMCEVIENRCNQAGLGKINVLNNAVWNKKELIYFTENGSGSKRDDAGEVCVEGIDIDSIVGKENVTYIKMDIEGSELMALDGAKNTIKSKRPRLAICIYHKEEDLFEIGSYLLELVPEYKFKIRHYASNIWETVLYAYV